MAFVKKQEWNPHQDSMGNTIIFVGRYIEVWKKPDKTYFEKKIVRQAKRRMPREEYDHE